MDAVPGSSVSPLTALLASATLLPPEGYGSWERPTVAFHNVPTRTRAERRAARDREQLEKERLKARREGFAHYVDPGSLIAPSDPSSAAYMDPRTRFTADFVADEKAARAATAARRAAEAARRGEEEAARDAARWHAMEAARAAEEERLARLREDGSKARRNRNGKPFDPITLEYHTTPGGQALRDADDVLKYRAERRAVTLGEKSRGTEYNLLTGAHQPIVTPWGATTTTGTGSSSAMGAVPGGPAATAAGSAAAGGGVSGARGGAVGRYGGGGVAGAMAMAEPSYPTHGRRAAGRGDDGSSGAGGGVAGSWAAAAPPPAAAPLAGYAPAVGYGGGAGGYGGAPARTTSSSSVHSYGGGPTDGAAPAGGAYRGGGDYRGAGYAAAGGRAGGGMTASLSGAAADRYAYAPAPPVGAAAGAPPGGGVDMGMMAHAMPVADAYGGGASAAAMMPPLPGRGGGRAAAAGGAWGAR